MTEMSGTGVEPVKAVGSYELWFLAQLGFGLAYLGGAMFVLPHFVLSLEPTNRPRSRSIPYAKETP